MAKAVVTLLPYPLRRDSSIKFQLLWGSSVTPSLALISHPLGYSEQEEQFKTNLPVLKFNEACSLFHKPYWLSRRRTLASWLQGTQPQHHPKAVKESLRSHQPNGACRKDQVTY